MFWFWFVGWLVGLLLYLQLVDPIPTCYNSLFRCFSPSHDGQDCGSDKSWHCDCLGLGADA